MKRFLLTLAILGLAATPVVAATTYTPSTTQLLTFTPLASHTNDSDWSNFGVYTTPGPTPGYGSGMLQGVVGYHAQGVGKVYELNWLGVGLEGLDLTDYDTFGLVVCNDNNQGWDYRLFASDGEYTNYSNGGAWASILNGNCMSMSVDLSGLSLGDVTVGLQIGRSDQSDEFHTSVSPIPAPGAMLLGSLGAGLVGWMRRRRSL